MKIYTENKTVIYLVFFKQILRGVPVSIICNNSYDHFLQFENAITMRGVPQEDYTVCSKIEETWQRRTADATFLTDCCCNCR
jgi:hypothetical protein